MEEYLELVFDIFDETGQHASVLNTLTVGELIDEIVSEFEDLESGDSIAYALNIATLASPLDPQRSLSEQGVQPGDRLIFGWVKKAQVSARNPVSRPGSATLQEVASGKIFPITWQPARIGRPDNGTAHNELLAVNLEWLPGAARVSRRHAQIYEHSGVFTLEAMVDQNPTFLNGNRLARGQRVRLAHNDRIELGFSGINLRFLNKSS